MMRVLLDTNILLDVLLNRAPWVTHAARIWSMCSRQQLDGYICASSFTDIFYIARRLTNVARACTAIRVCLATYAVCPVDRSVLLMADAMPGNDFEDNLQIACALLNDAEVIVTRNPDDFSQSPVPVMTGEEFLRWFADRT